MWVTGKQRNDCMTLTRQGIRKGFFCKDKRHGAQYTLAYYSCYQHRTNSPAVTEVETMTLPLGVGTKSRKKNNVVNWNLAINSFDTTKT